ncbi:MAG: hybrid sensor histidine kinase/response regulator [Desulfamplus sp.]|nr:hybrid sensor histidine kinase/response regulator [Desulfamplus sp.]
MKTMDKNSPDSLGGDRNRILIVDDNPTNLKVLFDYLSGEKGNRILVAKNGREALERIAFARPDIILLDIMMPEMDGYETCKRLKEDEKTRDIPIIFLTAFADMDNKIKAFRHGAVDFIVKPFNQEEVLARIDTHLTISRQKNALESANRALEQANAAKDKLFSIVAHDMRNKIFSLTGSIDLVRNFYDDLSDDELRDKINTMALSAHHMYKLFENLFTWARMQTGDIDVLKEKIDLAGCVNATLELFVTEAGSKGVDVVSDIPAGFYLLYDRNMLLFILRNLMHNAIKYCDTGDRVVISCDDNGKECSIAVRDTGMGMKREICDKIFDISSKTSRPGTRKEKGSGLGLLVAKEFAELNQGRLSIESREGEGTEVVITLPSLSISR